MLGISILLPSNDPTGIKEITMPGWTGKALIIPRAKLNEIGDRKDSKSPAIYFLFGESGESSRQKVYIGESETFFTRLINHNDTKDFWNSAVVFTGDLNRAHVKFLENRAIVLAKKANRHEIENKIEPLENKLSDFDKAAAEEFFEKMKIILSVSGYSIFQEVPTQKSSTVDYFFKAGGAEGRGTLLDTGEFVVYKGSTSRIRENASFLGTSGSGLRKRLEIEGILSKKNNQYFVTTKDYVFNSPSAAGETIYGGSTNGWTAWKDKEGHTLDENVRQK